MKLKIGLSLMSVATALAAAFGVRNISRKAHDRRLWRSRAMHDNRPSRKALVRSRKYERAEFGLVAVIGILGIASVNRRYGWAAALAATAMAAAAASLALVLRFDFIVADDQLVVARHAKYGYRTGRVVEIGWYRARHRKAA